MSSLPITVNPFDLSPNKLAAGLLEIDTMLDRHFTTVKGAKDGEYKTMSRASWIHVAACFDIQDMDRVFNDSGFQGDHDSGSDQRELDSLAQQSAQSAKSPAKVKIRS